MKKILLVALLLVLAHISYAEVPYYYFTKTINPWTNKPLNVVQVWGDVPDDSIAVLDVVNKKWTMYKRPQYFQIGEQPTLMILSCFFQADSLFYDGGYSSYANRYLTKNYTGPTAARSAEYNNFANILKVLGPYKKK